MQNMWPLQPVREHQRFVGKQFNRAPIGDDLTVIQNDGAGAQLHRQFQVVCRNQFGRGNPP